MRVTDSSPPERQPSSVRAPKGVAEGALRLAFFLTLLILGIEVTAGLISGSLALLADAGHILTDAVALGLAWFGVQQGKRPADARRTYGYQRVGILTALGNGLTLVLIVLWIGYEAAQRFAHPPAVQGGVVVIAALIAIGVNSFIALQLRGNKDNLNVGAAMLHVLGDLAASVGVVLAGVIILLTGWLYADPLISVGIAALIAWGALRIVLDTVNILLEGVPKGIDLGAVESAIARTPGIEGVHDLHIWSVSGRDVALSAHVVVPLQNMSATEHLVREVEQSVCARFGIAHTTIQAEACHPCTAGTDHGAGDHNHPHADDLAGSA